MRLIWTKEEEEILKKHYPTAETEELLELLPRFTIDKIRVKASKLGIKRKKRSRKKSGHKMKRWTDEEIDKLKQIYSHSTNEELEEIFPQFTMRQIRYKARNLGLEKLEDVKKKDNRQRISKMIGESAWTKEEEVIMEENYPILGSTGMLKLLPGRTQEAISSKAIKMGLSTTKEDVWRTKEATISKDDVFSISITFERVN